MIKESIGSQLLAAIQAMSGWEMLAVLLALAYLLLAVKERIECWYFAFVSTAIYIFLFWDVNLLMESALQVYYLAMAVYGWWQWQKQGDAKQSVTIHTWSLKQHGLAITLIVVLASVSGYFLSENSSAALPYLDSFTTVGAVVTTYMVARKVLENWLYWIAVDGVSIYLYIDRELYLTAILFVLYVIIVIIGFMKWMPLYRAQQAHASL